MHLLGNLCRWLICMPQLYFDACNQGTVYPVLACGFAGLTDNGTEVTLRETQTIGIVAYLVMLYTMLTRQLDKAIEDGLLART